MSESIFNDAPIDASDPAFTPESDLPVVEPVAFPANCPNCGIPTPDPAFRCSGCGLVLDASLEE